MYNESKREFFFIFLISALLHLLAFIMILLSRLDDSVKEYKNFLTEKQKPTKEAKVIFKQPKPKPTPKPKPKPEPKKTPAKQKRLTPKFTAGRPSLAPTLTAPKPEAPKPPPPIRMVRQAHHERSDTPSHLSSKIEKKNDQKLRKNKQENNIKKQQPDSPKAKIRNTVRALRQAQDDRIKKADSLVVPVRHSFMRRRKPYELKRQSLASFAKTQSPKKVTLADITKGFMNFARQQEAVRHSNSNHLVHIKGKNIGQATAEQLKHERYIKKLFDCIETSFNLHRRKFRFTQPPHTDPLCMSALVDLNKQGQIVAMNILTQSHNTQFDMFMTKVVKDASRSFPPVPSAFHTDIYSLPVEFVIAIRALYPMR